MSNLHPATAFTTAFATLTLGTAFAQTSLVLPAEYDRAWGRTSSAALGGNVTRTQIVFTQPFAPGTVVLGIGLRDTTATADRASFTAEVEVRMSSTTATPGALNSIFANNIGSDEFIALPRQIVTIPARDANRSTGVFAELAFPVPFVFGLNGSPNVCIDLSVFSRSAGAEFDTDRVFASANGRAANTGIGCGAGTINSTTAGGTYVAGSTVTLQLANAPANTFGMLLYSFDLKEWAPGLLLPIDLSIIGAEAGCDLMLETSQGVNGFLANGAGAASAAFTIPLGLSRFGMGWQWGYFVTPTPANPLGVEVTATRAMWIGPEVAQPQAGYVYDLFNATDGNGTATTNAAPIVKFLLP
jgi:hypothetical protein